jgi:hypothetical protein
MRRAVSSATRGRRAGDAHPQSGVADARWQWPKSAPSASHARRSRRVLTAALGVLAIASLASPAGAGADIFGPISLVSEGSVGGGEAPPRQVEYAHDPAISGDGRYVAFDGSIGGVTGVWRRNLGNGEIQQVAGGDAELPSISEEGRYISFTTNEGSTLAEITNGKPDAHPKQEAVNVYRRDMDVPVPASGRCEAAQPCPFAVVSAPSGSSQPLTYAVGASAHPDTVGSTAIGRSAINAEGNEVAFVTTAVSDLVKTENDRLAEAKGEPPPPETPVLQVAVRYLESETTKLVSGRYEAAGGRTTETPVSASEGTEQFGAVYPGAGMSFIAPPAYGQYGSNPPPGASLSADGSTVAWMGEDVGEQVPTLPGEEPKPLYTEPLWRRIEPGAETPTERVTGGPEPQNPLCVAGGETLLPETPSLSDPCQGPFVALQEGTPEGIMDGGAGSNFVPRLSKNGETVAFVSQAPLVSLGENFGRGRSGQPSDLYLAEMYPDPSHPTRGQALTQLTELAGGSGAGIAGTASITDFDISPNGEQVAFTTKRTQFPLGSPAYVSPPAGEPGMDELFEVDLADHTLTRVTRGYDGGPSEHPHIGKPSGQDPYEDESDGALSPSFSTNGRLLAFSSTASNLVWGDGNTPPVELGGTLDGGDAFVVERQLFDSLPSFSSISPAPDGPALVPTPVLSATAVSRGDGSVLLYVEVPAAGALRAGASATVPLLFAAPSRAARHTRPASRPRGRVGRAEGVRRASTRPLGTVSTRSVAGATTTAGAAEVVSMVLHLAKPYAALASHPGGLSATVHLLFAADAGGPVLRQAIAVSFVRIAPAARGARRRGSRRR